MKKSVDFCRKPCIIISCRQETTTTTERKKQNKFEKFEKLLDKFRKESIMNTRVTTEAENASESFKVCFCKEKEKTLKKMKKVVDKHRKM